MKSIETLNNAIEHLINNYQEVKNALTKAEQELVAKDDLILDLQAQLEQKSYDLDALINKISAALGQ